MAKATATNGKKKAAKKSAPVNRIENAVVVRPLNIGKLELKLIGTSPLVVHNFDEKSRREMLEAQMGKKKAKLEVRCPEAEFLQSLYWAAGEPPAPDGADPNGVPTYSDGLIESALSQGVFGIPLSAFKQAIVSACRNTDLNMTDMRQTVFVNGPEDKNFAVIDGAVTMDNRIVRIGARKPMERFRARFDEWSTKIIIEFDRHQIDQAELVNLVALAGHCVGVCEGRPEKSALGWGRWKLG